VKAIQAAARLVAARSRPAAMPTWLDAGPGRNWQSATSRRSSRRRASAALHELGAEISEMRDRTAEGGEAEPQENAEDLEPCPQARRRRRREAARPWSWAGVRDPAARG